MVVEENENENYSQGVIETNFVPNHLQNNKDFLPYADYE